MKVIYRCADRICQNGKNIYIYIPIPHAPVYLLFRNAISGRNLNQKIFCLFRRPENQPTETPTPSVVESEQLIPAATPASLSKDEETLGKEVLTN